MFNQPNFDLLALAALACGFLIVLPASMNIAHRLYGGSHVTVASWLGFAAIMGAITGVILIGKALGHPYLAFIPAFVAGYLTGKVCEWLELHDGWTPEKPFDPLAAKRWTVGFGLLAVLLALIPEFLALPLPALFVIYTASGTCGMSAMNVAALGFLAWRKDERRRSFYRS